MNKRSGAFSEKLLDWFDQHGRKNLPWQTPRNAYFVWVSEIMLQQTQVSTVINYFERFIVRFPTLSDSAHASLDEVLTYWAGLGYYRRARNLHQTAQIIQERYQGEFPTNIEELQQLPGIGRSTAGAIIAQAFNQFAVILDGNVKRVLSRYRVVGSDSNENETIKKLWQLAEEYTPKRRVADYTQAIMDLGALACTRSKPQCDICPLTQDCEAFKADAVEKFPPRKKTKILPERERFFLLVINAQQEILIEQQPATGIWSGLWSFPTASKLEEFLVFIPKIFLVKKKILKRFVHRFSHFKLTLKPVLITEVPKKIQVSTSVNQKWVPLKRLQEFALPTPIKKIIALCHPRNP